MWFILFMKPNTNQTFIGRWWGTPWIEIFISFILARILQLYVPVFNDIGLIVLVPVFWLVVHYTLGGNIQKYGNKDIFGFFKRK